MKYQLCQKHKLLRRCYGEDVVSSAALHALLGEADYQRFIRTLWARKTRKPWIGFYPEHVEPFLREVQP